MASPPTSLSERRLLLFPSDRALVLALREGRDEAAEALFDRYHPLLLGLVSRILGARPEVEDVVHDALLDALTHADQVKDPDRFRSWMVSIGLNHARAVLKKERRGRLSFVGGSPELEQIDPTDVQGVPGHTQIAIRRLLQKLDADAQVLVVLRYVEEYSLIEIAELVGLSLATVKRNLARAGELLNKLALRDPTLIEEAGRLTSTVREQDQ